MQMGTKAYSKSPSTPRATTSNFIDVHQQGHHSLVSQRNVDESMMGQRTHRSEVGRLLSTAWSSRRDKETNIFAPVTARSPNTHCFVPERFPLGREIPITGWDSHQDSIVFQKHIWFSNRVGRLRRRMHLIEDFLGEGFGDSIYVTLTCQFPLEG